MCAGAINDLIIVDVLSKVHKIVSFDFPFLSCFVYCFILLHVYTLFRKLHELIGYNQCLKTLAHLPATITIIKGRV